VVAIAEHQEVFHEEAMVKTISALEDRCREQQPATGYRNPLKWQTQDDDIEHIYAQT
jgi:hypothetical protein